MTAKQEQTKVTVAQSKIIPPKTAVWIEAKLDTEDKKERDISLIPDENLFFERQIRTWPCLCKIKANGQTDLVVANTSINAIELKKGITIGYKEPDDEYEHYPTQRTKRKNALTSAQTPHAKKKTSWPN
jgi:hypothetical protein